jgi:predicted MFS family arabinose efflux permease
VADRIGGLRTLLAGSVCQAAALTGFLLTQDELGLFAVSTAFGLGFAGLIPAYIVAIRETFSGRRGELAVPTLLFLSLIGMALGGWGAGRVYDYFGYYAPAFAMGVVSNLVHFAIIAALVAGDRRPSPGRALSVASTVYPQAKPL